MCQIGTQILCVEHFRDLFNTETILLFLIHRFRRLRGLL